jgi:hypothetical protein
MVLMTRLVGAIALLLALAAPARAALLHVDDGATPGGDGSAASPYQSLQVAIDAAAGGDEIRVAGGTYGPIRVSDKVVQLLGGYNADFTARGAVTPSVLQGTPAGPTVSLFNAGSTVLDGFTIRGGQRGVEIDGDFDATTNRPQVRFNLIEQNGTTTLNGGGVAAQNCDAALIGNTIRGNIALRGAGASVVCNSILIEGNLIEGNVGHEDHGGGLNLAGPDLVVRGNLIRNNEIGVILGFGWGGGAIAFNPGTRVRFERNVFTGNRAKSLGSGAFIDDGAVATFDHDLFYANQCTDVGGAAIYVDGLDANVASHVTLVHVTIAAHRCPDTLGNAIFIEPPPAARSTVQILNSIIWDNGGDDFAASDLTAITATYTLSQEPLAGTGNLSADPLFADPAGGDFHVRSTRGRFDPASGSFVADAVDSPTIDAGDPGSDFSLEPAPNGLRVNLGHTGNTGQASLGGPGGTPPPAGQVALTVATAGSGLGTVMSSPAGIACGPSCTATFASGTSVTLTAAPAAGSTFAGWSGGGCSGTAPCIVALTANVAVTATFTAASPALPALTLQINAPSFGPGQALVLTATLTPGATPMLVDAYVVIRLPDGSLLSLRLDGGLVPGIAPIATGLTPIALTQPLLSYTFTGGEPAGTYTWMSALTQAGTGNVVGSIREVPFAFSP